MGGCSRASGFMFRRARLWCWCCCELFKLMEQTVLLPFAFKLLCYTSSFHWCLIQVFRRCLSSVFPLFGISKVPFCTGAYYSSWWDHLCRFKFKGPFFCNPIMETQTRWLNGSQKLWQAFCFCNLVSITGRFCENKSGKVIVYLYHLSRNRQITSWMHKAMVLLGEIGWKGNRGERKYVAFMKIYSEEKQRLKPESLIFRIESIHTVPLWTEWTKHCRTVVPCMAVIFGIILNASCDFWSPEDEYGSQSAPERHR